MMKRKRRKWLERLLDEQGKADVSGAELLEWFGVGTKMNDVARSRMKTALDQMGLASVPVMTDPTVSGTSTIWLYRHGSPHRVEVGRPVIVLPKLSIGPSGQSAR